MVKSSAPHQLAARIKQRARDTGFDLVGIAPAEPSAHINYFRRWLDDGNAGTMNYLGRRLEHRTNPQLYLPGAASIICLAINYYIPLSPVSRGQSPGRIARYALGDDYHEILKPRLHALADFIRQQVPDARTRACVDTAPVMEKEIAARTGVGWMGKNTCLINSEIGSWLLLGEVITTIDLPFDDPAVDRCGTCRRCIDACPTSAITAPYQLDARRCISYLTIEYKGPYPPDLTNQSGDWLYGCDICQDVCPWNKAPPVAADPALRPRFPTGRLDANAVATWTDDDYRRHLRHSAMKRVKLSVLRDNARRVASVLADHVRS